MIFIEGVLATIEIKTNLNASVLKTIGDNIKSVNLLSPKINARSEMRAHSWPSDKVLNCIITYGGSNLASYIDQLREIEDKSKPDLILDLSQGLLIKNHGFLVKQEEKLDYLLVNNAADGFKYFLTFLTEITGTHLAKGVAWRSYV